MAGSARIIVVREAELSVDRGAAREDPSVGSQEESVALPACELDDRRGAPEVPRGAGRRG